MENLWNGLKRNRAFQVMTLLVLALILIAVFAPELTPYNPLRARMRDAFQAPSAAHWFGTDKLGRDCFSRILYGLTAQDLPNEMIHFFSASRIRVTCDAPMEWTLDGEHEPETRVANLDNLHSAVRIMIPEGSDGAPFAPEPEEEDA